MASGGTAGGGGGSYTSIPTSISSPATTYGAGHVTLTLLAITGPSVKSLVHTGGCSGSGTLTLTSCPINGGGTLSIIGLNLNLTGSHIDSSHRFCVNGTETIVSTTLITCTFKAQVNDTWYPLQVVTTSDGVSSATAATIHWGNSCQSGSSSNDIPFSTMTFTTCGVIGGSNTTHIGPTQEQYVDTNTVNIHTTSCSARCTITNHCCGGAVVFPVVMGGIFFFVVVTILISHHYRCNNAYNGIVGFRGVNVTGASGGIQAWTVPHNGTYSIALRGGWIAQPLLSGIQTPHICTLAKTAPQKPHAVFHCSSSCGG
jgi:hypothetical protein